jgi:DNA-directed RNA polymerase
MDALLPEGNNIISFRKEDKQAYKTYLEDKSKFALQNNILNIADAFRKAPSTYFPLRIDSRARLYCEPCYLNYQSTELAKSLLLFSEPTVMHRYDEAGMERIIRLIQAVY